jgi:Helix-turn-helix domain
MQDEFLTTPEAATFLRLTPSTLNNYRVSGGGPQFRKLNRRVLYSRKDLLAWADSKSYGSTSVGAHPPRPRDSMRYLEPELAPRDDHRARQRPVRGGFVTPDKPLASPRGAVQAALKRRRFALASPSQD